MDLEEKKSIVASFPSNYARAELGVILTKGEYAIFEKGIYAGSMDEKWNIFVLNNVLVLQRSWTGNCIYKVNVEQHDGSIILKDFEVNRHPEQYRGKNIEEDIAILKRVLKIFLTRKDLYIHPKLILPLIREIIELEDPEDKSTKMVDSRSVGQVLHMYNILSTAPNDALFVLNGWQQFSKNLSGRAHAELLTSVYIADKERNYYKTFYFDEGATALLGSIVIEKIKE